MSRKQNLNLKPPYTSDQDREEASKNGKKGGIASGEARRRKRTMTQLVNQYLGFKVKNTDVKAALMSAGFTEEECDNKTMLMMTIAKNAAKGNAKFTEMMIKLAKDDELIELEKKRLKKEIEQITLQNERQKLENERLRNAVENKNDTEDWGGMFEIITGQKYDPNANPDAHEETEPEKYAEGIIQESTPEDEEEESCVVGVVSNE